MQQMGYVILDNKFPIQFINNAFEHEVKRYCERHGFEFQVLPIVILRDDGSAGDRYVLESGPGFSIP